MKKSLIIIGIILIVLTIIMMSSIDKEEIIRLNKGCESSIGGAVQFFSEDITEECKEIKNKMLLVNYGFLGYIIGIILIILGFSKEINKKLKNK